MVITMSESINTRRVGKIQKQGATNSIAGGGQRGVI